jgi:hypothetical protein
MDGHRGTGSQCPGWVVRDSADDLMTEHQRFPQAEGADGAMLVVVQVGSADAAVGVADENLARFG